MYGVVQFTAFSDFFKLHCWVSLICCDDGNCTQAHKNVEERPVQSDIGYSKDIDVVSFAGEETAAEFDSIRCYDVVSVTDG